MYCSPHHLELLEVNEVQEGTPMLQILDTYARTNSIIAVGDVVKLSNGMLGTVISIEMDGAWEEDDFFPFARVAVRTQNGNTLTVIE